MPPKTNNSVLEERLNNLESMSREGFTRLEKIMSSIDKRLHDIETSTLAEVAVQKTRLDAAWTKIDEHTNQINDVAEWMQKTKPLISAIVWLASALGVLILGLLWAIFTHQITLN